MNTETDKETINVSRNQGEKECPGQQKRKEKNIQTQQAPDLTKAPTNTLTW